MRLLGSGPRQATKTFRIQERALPPSGPQPEAPESYFGHSAPLRRNASGLAIVSLSRTPPAPAEAVIFGTRELGAIWPCWG